MTAQDFFTKNFTTQQIDLLKEAIKDRYYYMDSLTEFFQDVDAVVYNGRAHIVLSNLHVYPNGDILLAKTNDETFRNIIRWLLFDVVNVDLEILEDMYNHGEYSDEPELEEHYAMKISELRLVKSLLHTTLHTR